MTSPPVASIIIPVYQQELYVAEAVGSALAQTQSDIEVIAVDDGSTDRSAEIIEAISDPRLILVRRHNGGPSAALNDGLKRARGRFIAFLGGDDVAEPDRIEQQIACATRRGVDILFSLPQLIDEHGRYLRDLTMSNIFQRPDDMESHQVFRRLLIDGNFLCAPTCLIRRELLDQIGYFRDELIQLQDYDYWLRATGQGKSIFIMQSRTTRYRRHPHNLSGKSGDEAMRGELMSCLARAIADSSSAVLARAFPDMMAPGRMLAEPLDRAMIAVMHPQAKSLGVAFMLQAYLSGHASLDMPGMAMSRLGVLTHTDSSAKLGLLPASRDDRLALERSYMASSGGGHGNEP